MTSLDVRKCIEYSVWCGKGPIPSNTTNNKKYYRKGKPEECLKIGFGAGYYSEVKKNLSLTSLRQIKYVGEKYEKNFRKEKIGTITTLITKMKKLSAVQKRTFLLKIFKRQGAGLDKRAYNATILFLHTKGVGNLPSCSTQKKPK